MYGIHRIRDLVAVEIISTEGLSCGVTTDGDLEGITLHPLTESDRLKILERVDGWQQRHHCRITVKQPSP